MKTYEVQVTRTEIREISEDLLNRERIFRRAQKDRSDGKPCKEYNGPYLNGWYHPDKLCWYVPYEARHLV